MKNKFNFLACLFASAITTSANANNKETVIIDVRTPQEYQESHLKGSVLIDVLDPQFKSKIAKLDKSKNYQLYCRSGNRSSKAVEIMKSEGFKNLENLGSLQQAAKKTNISCDGKPC